jgi:hypothetical protein
MFVFQVQYVQLHAPSKYRVPLWKKSPRQPSEQRCSINVGNIASILSLNPSILLVEIVPFPPNPIAFGLIFSLILQIFGPRSAVL